ncbi:hypothetical protein [Streptomyces sp. NPDC048650]|uniref:hypothetical protein n=1 Tax=Streptomyces sp. NPDC048650 TaxID=3365583 RepID=UPI0037210795
MDFYRERTLRKLVQLLSAMTAIILIAVVVGLIKGTPGADRLAIIAPVTVGCTVLAILGWRKDKAWMAYSSGAAYLIAVGSLTLLR